MTYRVLVTGISGFFGRAITRLCLSTKGNQFKLVGLSRNPARFAHMYPTLAEKIELHGGNILDFATLEKIPAVSHVIHAAADSAHLQLNDIERFDQIVSGTRNILELALRHRVKKFIYISSGAVYGPRAFGRVSETSKIAMQVEGAPDPYGAGKITAEYLCHLYSKMYSLPTVIARCFAFIGQDLPLDAHYAIGNFIYDAINNQHIDVQSDGSSVRSYLDQRDLAACLLNLLKKGKPSEIYNVGSSRPVSIKEVAYIVRDVLSPGKKIVFRTAKASAKATYYVPSTDKIVNDLGFSESYSLEDSIRNIAEVLGDRTQLKVK